MTRFGPLTTSISNEPREVLQTELLQNKIGDLLAPNRYDQRGLGFSFKIGNADLFQCQCIAAVHDAHDEPHEPRAGHIVLKVNPNHQLIGSHLKTFTDERPPSLSVFSE